MIHVALAFHDHDGNYALHAAAVFSGAPQARSRPFCTMPV